MERVSLQPDQQGVLRPEAGPLVGGTVLELMASMSELPELRQPGTPPPTPPVEISTTTRSGEGYVQIPDDTMSDQMYE